MKIEILHAFRGDKEKDLPTDTPENRQKTAEAVKTLLESGIALFLESGRDAYYVRGYDPEKDVLLIETPRQGAKLRTEGKKSDLVAAAAEPKRGKRGRLRRVTGVAPVRGGC